MDKDHQTDQAPVPTTGAGSTGSAIGDTEPQGIAVLYVDDELVLLEPTKISLEKKKGFFVDTAMSAKEALEKIAARSYDVIVSDYQMPEMDGIQLLRKLRDENNGIPFIIFTGKGREEAVIEAYNAGADFYLAKGGNPKAMFLDLANKIRQTVNRKRAEKALRESEERYRKLVEQSHDAIYIYQGTKFVFVNDRVSEISGYSKNELYRMNILDILHPDDKARIGEISRKRMSGEDAPQTYEARILTKKGEVRYLELSMTSLVFNGSDAAQGSVRDITERRIAEDALRKSEEKYRSIFNSFDDLYYQTDLQGIIKILSPSCKKITGWDASELLGHQVLDLYPFPEQRKILLGEMFTNGAIHDYEVILKNKEGKHLIVSVTSHVVRDESGNPQGVEGSLRDITERKQIEEALHASEERFRTLADFLPVIVFETNISGTLTFTNRLAYPTFGIGTTDVMSGLNVIDHIVPEQRKTAKENMAKIFAGEVRNAIEYTLQRKDGSRFPAMISTSGIIDRKTGKVSGLRGVIIDLTELKTKDAELQQSEESYHGLFNTVKDAICILDTTGRFIDVNKGAEEMFGHPHEFFIGKTFETLSAPGRNDLAHAFGQVRVASLGRPRQFEFWGLRNGGDEFLTEVRLYKGTYFGKDAVIFLAVDITDRKKAEEELKSSEQYLKTIFNSVQTGLVIIDPGTYTIIDANPAAITLIGADRNAIIGATCEDFICHTVKGKCQFTDSHLERENVESILIRADGQKVPILKTVIPVTISGKPAFLESILDITDRKRAEDAMQKAYFELEQKVGERTKELSELTLNLQDEIAERKRVMEALATSEEKYRSLVEQIGDIVFHIDENGHITYMSPHVLAKMGMTGENLQKLHARDLAPPEYQDAIGKYLDPAISEHPQVSGFEIHIPIKGTGSSLILEVNATTSFDKTGRFTGYSGIARDITVRKNLENEVAASLKEKEILLKEIHHRVKNNMQVISSLLSLQARLMKDPGSREAIRESQNRVMSIALVHEKLYQSKNLARIHYDDYLKKIGENLLQSYGIPAGKIRLDIHADDMVLPISKAIPVSLIINEMLSNALKYAFPQDRTGTITIDFRRTGEHYILVVKDDGVGLPGKIVLDSIETLGLQLVNSLVAQIQGTLTLQRENGTEYRIEFDFEPGEGDHYG
ncbi:PAS domain S-box protein [Methanoregula sp.]|jgi:PAS domain S-box-containing protein|uniref:PAS domain S-box protein n=1 Tax=Methanoregula sp. TaxID=2052170 RepID=UPI003C1CBFB3